MTINAIPSLPQVLRGATGKKLRTSHVDEGRTGGNPLTGKSPQDTLIGFDTDRLSLPHKSDEPVSVSYMEQFSIAVETAIDTLNTKEPLKNNVITGLAAGDRLYYDGATWRNMPEGITVYGDEAATLTPRTSDRYNVFSTTLTADRAVTLSTTNAFEGLTYRVTRTAAGAFNLNVGTGPLVALVQDEWCDVVYDGSAWILIARGSLADASAQADHGWGGTTV